MDDAGVAASPTYQGRFGPLPEIHQGQAPDFLIISPSKTGSTWLAANLRAHPGIFVPAGKELSFFSYFYRHLGLSWYFNAFREGAGRCKGEASPGYATLPANAIREVHALFPALKLIFLMRDPVQRAWSHAKHNHKYHEASFRDCDEPIERVSTTMWLENFTHPWPAAQGDYLSQLLRWTAVFPKQQFFVGFFEQIINDPRQLLRDIFGFLGVAPDVDFADFPLHARIMEGPALALPPKLQTPLRQVLALRTVQLAEYLQSEFQLACPATWLTARGESAAKLGGDRRNSGEFRYDAGPDDHFMSLLEQHPPHGVVLLEEGFRGYNLVWHRRGFYAFHQRLGPMDAAAIVENDLERARHGNDVLTAGTLADLKDAVLEVLVRSGLCDQTELLEQGFHGYNLVAHQGRLLAFAQGLGSLNLHDMDQSVWDSLEAWHAVLAAPTMRQLRQTVRHADAAAKARATGPQRLEVLTDLRGSRPRVSFVLLDWSCRESAHILDYLNDQTVARDRYEIIWIEYYAKRSAVLETRIADARAARASLPVDVHAIMGMPESVYYHKHLMYNVGIRLARGEIVCFCDSDAFMHRTFVESIVRAFEQDPNIVLHMDEVRNNDHQFYPFNHPSFDEVVGPGCANWLNGRPLGLLDPIDPLHTRNYGACMCARRDDLIAIGGADLHLDYLGHICGPYELTFRLVNAGKREVWHGREWLYHVWHPGQAGDRNYAGPHDGRHMSTTALTARRTGRILPLTPDPAIERMRRGEKCDRLAVLDDLCAPERLTQWDVRGVATKAHSYRLGNADIALHERTTPGAIANTDAAVTQRDTLHRRLGKLGRLRLTPLVLGLLHRQFQMKYRTAHFRLPPMGTVAVAHEPMRKFRATLGFFRRMLAHNRHLLKSCWQHLCYVAALEQREIMLYGDGDAARILTAMAGLLKIRVRAVQPFDAASSDEWLQAYDGMVVVAAFVNTAEHVRRLERLGLDRARLVVLE